MGTLLEEECGGTAFETLDDDECVALIGDRVIGRVAVTIGAIPAVFPVSFTFLDGAIYFRTAEGTQLARAVCRSVVAFEVDDLDAVHHQGWSVLAVGVARPLEPGAPAVEALASRLPLRALASGEKDQWMRIWPEFLSGRRITGTGPGPTSWP